MNLKTAVERCQPFDTPAMRATQGEQPLTKLVTTPFVLSALRSKVYRSMSGVATAFFRMNQAEALNLLGRDDSRCDKVRHELVYMPLSEGIRRRKH